MEQQYRTRLPGWEILEPPIGTGGFSTVYEIVRVDKFGMEEHAALKVISVPENKSDIEAFRDDGLDDKSITAYFKTQVDDISREFLLLSDMKGNSHIVSYEDHQIVQHDHDPGWDILIRMELLASLTDYYRANFAGTAIDETTVIKSASICAGRWSFVSERKSSTGISSRRIFLSIGTAILSSAISVSPACPTIRRGRQRRARIPIWRLRSIRTEATTRRSTSIRSALCCTGC